MDYSDKPKKPLGLYMAPELPVEATVDISLEVEGGSGQEDARRIVEMLKRKQKKSISSFGDVSEMLEEISEDPFGAAAKYAVKVGE